MVLPGAERVHLFLGHGGSRCGTVIAEKKFRLRLRQPLKNSLLAVLLLCGLAGICLAQNILPGLDTGRDRPTGWRLVGTNGLRVAKAAGAPEALNVVGNGNDQSFWQADRIAVVPGSVYSLTFFARAEGESGQGVAISGLKRVNRDFVPVGTRQEYGFIFNVPTDETDDLIRLGQWHLKASLSFDTPALLPVIALHRRIAPGAELGEGESVRAGVYRFRPSFGWMGANYHRPLFANRASFNSDRWVFASGAEVIYRLGFPGSAQLGGRVQVAFGHYAGGLLQVDASREGRDWIAVAT